MADHSNTPANNQREMTPHEAFESARLLAEAYSTDTPTTTHYRDITPLPTQGTAVPHAQPGRPPMSQKATDHASLVLAYSLGSLPVGAATSLILWSLSSVNPTTLAIAAATPPALIAAIGVATKMIGRAAADCANSLPPTTIHHHTGPTHVHHTELQVRTRTGWFGRTINQLPPSDQ